MQAIHQVMSLGHLKLMNMVLSLGADPNAKMKNGLTTMHCATQTYHGLLSMAVLKEKYATQVDI